MKMMPVGSNIFDSEAQLLVNPVNCVGVMGAGLALQFAKRWPAMLRRYQEMCEYQGLRLGRPHIDQAQEPWIANFPTKNHYTHAADIAWIRRGLHFLSGQCDVLGIRSVALPALGCGLGGLNVEDVMSVFEEFDRFTETDVEFYSSLRRDD